MQNLDLNLLKVFESLYREQNMTRTADVLNITPSAVSHAVRRLREALNDPLFIRQGATMQPTPACRRVAPELLAHLFQLRKTLQLFMDFVPETTEQSFNIAIHSALESLFIPLIYQIFSIEAPKATLNCVPLDRHQLSRQMAAGQVDAAIDIALPLTAPIKHEPISNASFCVMMNSSHCYRAQLTQTDYLQAKHIIVSNRPRGTAMEDIELQQQGISRNSVMRCQTYLTASQILQQSDLLLTLPTIIGKQYLNDALIMHELPFAVPDIETHLYWHDNAEHDAAMQWLRSKIKTCWNDNQTNHI